MQIYVSANGQGVSLQLMRTPTFPGLSVEVISGQRILNAPVAHSPHYRIFSFHWMTWKQIEERGLKAHTALPCTEIDDSLAYELPER
jgi:hypothetical protein